MSRRLPSLLATALLAACTSKSTEPTTDRDAGKTASRDAGEAPARDGGVRDAGPAVECNAEGPTEVTVRTDDGLDLEGDLYTTGEVGAPGVVLLHMIPPSNTRANYPANFIQALVQRGFNVLNLDRRGAGGDATLARTAYTGPDGKLDPKAAIAHLVDHDCATDRTRIAIIGASNGTTSALDYTVFAAANASEVQPKALVFLTGGSYTETQNRIADHRATLDPLPIQFVFSTAERAWSAQFDNNPPAAWRFDEYQPGAHGTRMFGTAPQAVDDVAAFLAGVL